MKQRPNISPAARRCEGGEGAALGIPMSACKLPNEIVNVRGAAGPGAVFPFQMTQKICLRISLLLLTRLRLR